MSSHVGDGGRAPHSLGSATPGGSITCASGVLGSVPAAVSCDIASPVFGISMACQAGGSTNGVSLLCTGSAGRLRGALRAARFGRAAGCVGNGPTTSSHGHVSTLRGLTHDRVGTSKKHGVPVDGLYPQSPLQCHWVHGGWHRRILIGSRLQPPACLCDYQCDSSQLAPPVERRRRCSQLRAQQVHGGNTPALHLRME